MGTGIQETRFEERGHRYKLWALDVLQRDNYKCVDCEAFGCELHSHHIVPWSESKELRYELDNGKTVCLPCHAKYHPWMGKYRKITNEQYARVYSDGTVKVDIERLHKKSINASRFIVSLYKKYQSKHGRLMFGVAHANSFLKKKGFSRDVRRYAWDTLESSGLIIRYKQSAVLVPAIMRTPPRKRVKLLPAQVILEFKRLASDVLGAADKEYDRITTLDLLAKKKKNRKDKMKGLDKEEELKMQEEYIKNVGVTKCPSV